MCELKIQCKRQSTEKKKNFQYAELAAKTVSLIKLVENL